MTRHPTGDELDRFVDGRAAPDELAWIDRHLDECPACRQALSDRVPSTPSFLRTARDPDSGPHLPFETLEALVEGRAGASDQQAVRAHLEACDTCRFELEDLRAFEATRAIAPVARTAAAPAPGLWDRVLTLVRAPSASQLGWVGAAAAAAIVLAILPEQPDGPGRGTASVVESSRTLSGIDQVRLSAERRARMQAILDGTAGTARASEPRELADLSDTERDLWSWAQSELAGDPMLLGALAEDLGLVNEARAAYQRAIDAQPASPDARRLLDRLNQRR